MSIGFLVIWFLIVQAEPKVGTYGFVHQETTGITSSVIVNGVERRIQFHPDSDPIAVKSLNALTWRNISSKQQRKETLSGGPILYRFKTYHQMR